MSGHALLLRQTIASSHHRLPNMFSNTTSRPPRDSALPLPVATADAARYMLFDAIDPRECLLTLPRFAAPASRRLKTAAAPTA